MKTHCVKDISELLHKTPSTIYEEMRRCPNRPPPRLNILGEHFLWRESDEIDWIEKRRQKPQSTPLNPATSKKNERARN